MATYVWGCRACGAEVEVQREPSEFDRPPDEPCCDTPDRFRTIQGTSRQFGIRWSDTSYKDGRGGKGTW